MPSAQLPNQICKFLPADLTATISSFVVNSTLLLRPFFSRAQGHNLPYWFQRNFCGLFVLNYWLREFILSVIASHFDMQF